MNIIYYCEINLICILVLLLFTNQLHYKSDQFSSENNIFHYMLRTTVIMCISDMISGICRGQVFVGARMVIEISNLIYYETITIISFLWMVYVFTKLKIIKNYKKELLFWAIPLIAISVAVVSNHFTDFYFKIDENNLYERNVGVHFHWIVSWFYLLLATAMAIYKIMKEKNKNRRRKIATLILFFIAPAISAVIQMLFYGISCTQVGITISLVAISLEEQNNQILTDALTGLNNRYGFNKYWEIYMQHHLETELFLMMIDINNFKQVNDKFGHLEGDRALTDVAYVLKDSCENADSKLFVCRYGGDEFLVAGCNCTKDEIMDLKNQIDKKLKEKNILGDYQYELSVSMGVASSICLNSDDIDNLLRIADEAMYEEKKNRV